MVTELVSESVSGSVLPLRSKGRFRMSSFDPPWMVSFDPDFWIRPFPNCMTNFAAGRTKSRYERPVPPFDPSVNPLANIPDTGTLLYAHRPRSTRRPGRPSSPSNTRTAREIFWHRERYVKTFHPMPQSTYLARCPPLCSIRDLLVRSAITLFASRSAYQCNSLLANFRQVLMLE